jgi:hypothetical protein
MIKIKIQEGYQGKSGVTSQADSPYGSSVNDIIY